MKKQSENKKLNNEAIFLNKMISIIGAGPVGSFAAYLLAKAGFDVNIFEEHEKIGLPIQCTGLMTEKISELLELKKSFITNRLNKVKVFSQNSSAEINVNEILVDRQRFDQHLLDMAADAGAQVYPSHRFVSFHRHSGNIFFSKGGKIEKYRSKILIGADGPLSQVAKTAGIYGSRKFFIGMQATVQGNFDSTTYQTFFGNIAPGFFAWIVPESSTTARIGLATRYNTRKYFENFLKGKGKMIAMQAGLIPVYNHNQAVQKNNIYLIGDAATFCKATTGGGLISGLQSARILADCIIHNKNYSFAVKKLRRELLSHSMIRSALDRFSTSDYNRLVSIINNPRVKQQLSANSRDNSIKLLPKLIIADPRLLLFGKCLLQKRINI